MKFMAFQGVSVTPYNARLTNFCISDTVTWDASPDLKHILLLLLHQFNGLFSRTTWVSRYQKDKTSLDLSEATVYGVLGWQWHQVHLAADR